MAKKNKNPTQRMWGIIEKIELELIGASPSEYRYTYIYIVIWVGSYVFRGADLDADMDLNGHLYGFTCGCNF